MGEVVDAVRRDLEELAGRLPGIDRSGLAMTAVALAAELDDPVNSATSKSMCARVLVDTMDKLREMTPEQDQEGDALDELAKQRERRRGGAGTPDSRGAQGGRVGG